MTRLLISVIFCHMVCFIGLENSYAVVDRTLTAGESAVFLNHTIIGVSSAVRDDDPQWLSIVEQWHQALLHFQKNEENLSDDQIFLSEEVTRKAWISYDQRITDLLARARPVFGHQIGIVAEGDLKAAFDRAEQKQKTALSHILGKSGFQRREELKKQYRSLAIERLGWMPGPDIR